KLPMVETTWRPPRSSSSRRLRTRSPCFASCRAAGSRACRGRALRASAYSIHRARPPRPPARCGSVIRGGGRVRPCSVVRAMAAPRLRRARGGQGAVRACSRWSCAKSPLVRAADAELNRLFQCLLHRRGRKQGERVGGNRSIMPCALDGVFERAVLHHQADRIFEVCVGRVPLLKRAPPERPFALRSAAER